MNVNTYIHYPFDLESGSEVTVEVNFEVSRLQSLFFCFSSQTFIESLYFAQPEGRSFSV